MIELKRKYKLQFNFIFRIFKLFPVYYYNENIDIALLIFGEKRKRMKMRKVGIGKLELLEGEEVNNRIKQWVSFCWFVCLVRCAVECTVIDIYLRCEEINVRSFGSNFLLIMPFFSPLPFFFVILQLFQLTSIWFDLRSPRTSSKNQTSS